MRLPISWVGYDNYRRFAATIHVTRRPLDRETPLEPPVG